MAIQKYFYAYDKKLAKYLRYIEGLEWECHAIHPKSGDPFWQFLHREELEQAIDRYMRKINQ